MKAERLMQHFDRISEAPDAIPYLRRFILDLAVRGKLLEQDPNDEPATELIREILAEKGHLLKEGKIRSGKPLTALQTPPFAVPENWQWILLGEITELITKGSSPKWQGVQYVSKEDGILFVTSENVGNYRLRKMEEAKYVERRFNEIEPRSILSFGDILMNLVGASIGRTAIYDLHVEANINQAVALIRMVHSVPNLCTNFLLHYFNSRIAIELMLESRVVTAQPNMSLTDARQFPVPVPPLAEQRRIVAKVDELMALCDQLEAAKDQREQSRNRLVASSLHRLNQPTDDTKDNRPEAFRDHARFTFDHFSRLTTRVEHIKQLRHTILNLAVRGKLVPQNPNEEPVAVQLSLSDQMRQATAKKDRRADADLQSLLAAEDRWGVPSTWEWRALADLVLFIDYRGKTPTKEEQGVRLITAKNVRKGFIDPRPEEFISQRDYHIWMTRGLPVEGDVLFTTEAPMGNAAVVRLTERFALAQRVICFRNYGAVTPDFLVLQLLANPFQSILDKTATGLTAKGIKAAKLKRLPIAVPPLAEQHRIVAKVDELMAQCDQLEAQLATNEADSRRLLEAVLHEALNGSRQGI